MRICLELDYSTENLWVLDCLSDKTRHCMMSACALMIVIVFL